MYSNIGVRFRETVPLRREVADDKILIFLKGHFTICKKQLRDSTAELDNIEMSENC